MSKPITNEQAYDLAMQGLVLNPPPVREYEDPRMAEWVIKQNDLFRQIFRQIEEHSNLLNDICGKHQKQIAKT